ncbi:OsmC family protein [Gorillibacterium timonense]|uniref:OsmC family protein n=1 Tax=Gorillibacterium timonense TaxID=1689269 RepID=UPI00071DE046|nr:OsmC family protein [Gorillibacterium timonense]
MTTIRYNDGQNEIYNEQGFQLIGTTAPNLEGLNPKELLEASLGLCISITLQKQLELNGIQADPSEIVVKVAASKRSGVNSRFSDFNLEVSLPKSISPEVKEKLLKKVELLCTISNTLRISPEIQLTEV